MFCPYCGTKIAEGKEVAFCIKCGGSIASTVNSDSYGNARTIPFPEQPGASAAGQPAQDQLYRDQQAYYGDSQGYGPQGYGQQQDFGQGYSQNFSQQQNGYYDARTYYGDFDAPFGRKGRKNKWVAFLLCLFLGYIGIHKFYEGRIGLGILYVLTFGLCGIGWLIDLILILTKFNTYYTD